MQRGGQHRDHPGLLRVRVDHVEPAREPGETRRLAGDRGTGAERPQRMRLAGDAHHAAAGREHADVEAAPLERGPERAVGEQHDRAGAAPVARDVEQDHLRPPVAPAWLTARMRRLADGGAAGRFREGMAPAMAGGRASGRGRTRPCGWRASHSATASR